MKYIRLVLTNEVQGVMFQGLPAQSLAFLSDKGNLPIIFIKQTFGSIKKVCARVNKTHVNIAFLSNIKYTTLSTARSYAMYLRWTPNKCAVFTYSIGTEIMNSGRHWQLTVYQFLDLLYVISCSPAEE